LLGINTGWFDPSERGFYVIIIPKNQDAEFMGIYISACQIIGWLPPLVFTAMNQAGIPSSIGLATLSLYILLGLLALSFGVPSYEESMNQAREQELEEQEFEDVAHL
jgi:UMF1 family MFS transporter